MWVHLQLLYAGQSKSHITVDIAFIIAYYVVKT